MCFVKGIHTFFSMFTDKLMILLQFKKCDVTPQNEVECGHSYFLYVPFQRTVYENRFNRLLPEL